MQGVERVLAVAVVAAGVCAIAVRLNPPGTRPSPSDRGAGLLPFIVAGCLIVMAPSHPAFTFPLFQVGVVAGWMLWAPLVVCGFSDCHYQPDMKRWWVDRRLWIAAMLGMAAAVTFELLYATPAVVFAVAAARMWVADSGRRFLSGFVRTAAFRRAAAYAVGTVVVAAPVRLLIGSGSYVGTDIAVSTDPTSFVGSNVVDVWADPVSYGGVWLWRVMSASPPAGWMLTLWSEVGRLWPVALFAAAAAAVAAVRTKQPTGDGNGRRVIALLVVGGTLITIPTAVIATTAVGWATYGHYQLFPWRGTLIAQTGWAFVVAGAFAHMSRPGVGLRTRRTIAAVTATGMVAVAVFSHLALAAAIRDSHIGSALTAVSTVAVLSSPDPDHMRIRCAAADMLRTAMQDDRSNDPERVLLAADATYLRFYNHPWCASPDDHPAEFG